MDSVADSSIGAVLAEHLKLQTAESSTFSASIFVLPNIANLMLYLAVLGWAGRRSVAALAIGVVLFIAAVVGAYVFVDDVISVNPTQYVHNTTSEGSQYATPSPEAQYVAIIPAGPYEALREQHEVSWSLMFLWRQAADRADAGRIYEKLLLDSLLEVLAPIVILCPAALWRLWKQSTFTCGVIPTAAPSESSSESESESEYSYSELSCLSRLLWKSWDKLIEINRAFLPLIGASLMLIFLIAPLSHSAINEPGFEVLDDTGILISSATGTADFRSQQVRGLPTCPQSFDQDISLHYIDQMLWPDVTQDTPDGSSAIKPQSFAYEVFGTESLETVTNVLFEMNCSIPDVDTLAQYASSRSDSDSKVVYDAPDILSCTCRDVSLLGTYSEPSGVRCPTVQQLFQLIDRAGGPMRRNPLPGVKSMWNLALVVAYTMLAIQVVLILLQCALVLGFFAPEDLEKVVQVTVFVSGTLPLVLLGGQMLVQIGFFAVWVHGRGDHAPKELVLGNLCIVKTKNLYAGDLSSGLVVLIVAEVVLFISLRAAYLALAEHFEEYDESSDEEESQHDGSNPFVDTHVVNTWLVNGPEADTQAVHASSGVNRVADVEMVPSKRAVDTAPVGVAALGGEDISEETFPSVSFPLRQSESAEGPVQALERGMSTASSGMGNDAQGRKISSQQLNVQQVEQSSVADQRPVQSNAGVHSAAVEPPPSGPMHDRKDVVESSTPAGLAVATSLDSPVGYSVAAERVPSGSGPSTSGTPTAVGDRVVRKVGDRGSVPSGPAAAVEPEGDQEGSKLAKVAVQDESIPHS